MKGQERIDLFQWLPFRIMKFEIHTPTERLKPYIKYFAVSEEDGEREYRVFPSSSLVVGFQYKGRLSTIKDGQLNELSLSGITGISDSYKVFKNSPNIGTVLVFFTEVGFAHFAEHPVNELFNLSLSLDHIFDKTRIREAEERLAAATTDSHRIKVVEQFLLAQLKTIQTDKLIVEALKLIYESKGTVQVKELNKRLFISQSPFEKRFRKVVGTTPKKFASIVRFNAVLAGLNTSKSLTEICYENNFFDQAHFVKDFKQFTGETPESFKRLL